MLAGMRLLATDLDGTLVFHHAVGQADAEALVRWREACPRAWWKTRVPSRSVASRRMPASIARAPRDRPAHQHIDASALRQNLHK